MRTSTKMSEVHDIIMDVWRTTLQPAMLYLIGLKKPSGSSTPYASYKLLNNITQK